jgi:hypothetical protein
MRGDFGISIVLGCPFSQAFIAWAESLGNSAHGGQVESRRLHATLVNCTRPSARSVPHAEHVFKWKPEMRRVFFERLVPLLRTTEPFELSFASIIESGGTTILLSHPNTSLQCLVAGLQGGRAWIAKEDVELTLEAVVAVGVNKFATQHSKPVEALSVTLGRVPSGNSLSPPNDVEPVSSLRIVYYRDRSLSDAVISQPLRFGSAADELTYPIDSFLASF